MYAFLAGGAAAEVLSGCLSLMPTVAPAGNGADNGDFGSRFNFAAQHCADQECAGPCTPAGSGAMDDSLAGGAPGGSIAGGEFNVTALLALDAEAGSGGAGLLLGGAEKLACRSKENSPRVGATIEGAGAIGSSPLFAPAPNRFAGRVVGAAERADSSSCSTTECWSLELDGGPGGSDVA